MSEIINPGGGGGTGTITEGVTPTSGFTDGYAITSSGGFVGQAQIRIILTGNLNLYVNASTGSDSYNGLSATFTGGVNGPWATPQHAIDVISATLDFAGLIITLNLAAGSYAGFGFKSMVGGGVLLIYGAGSGTTTINAGPNDGVYNFGQCVSNYFSLETQVWINGVTFANNGPGVYFIYTLAPCLILLGNLVTGADADIGFIWQNNSGGWLVGALGQGSQIDFQAGTYTADATASTDQLGFFQATSQGLISLQGNWTLTGTINYGYAFCFLTDQAQLVVTPSVTSFTGSASGSRFNLATGSVIDTGDGEPYQGFDYFPGDTAGFCDPSSSYDGSPGGPAINTQTASYQIADRDAGNVVEMNAAVANNLTIPTNATTPFPINTRIDVVQIGAGQTTFVAAGGVTLHSAGGAVNIAAQYSGATIYQRAIDEWVLIGEIA